MFAHLILKWLWRHRLTASCPVQKNSLAHLHFFTIICTTVQNLMLLAVHLHCYLTSVHFLKYFKYDRKRPTVQVHPCSSSSSSSFFRLIKLILAISHEKKLPTSSLSSGQENGWKSPRSIRWTVSEEQNLNMTPRLLLLSCVTSHNLISSIFSLQKDPQVQPGRQLLHPHTF